MIITGKTLPRRTFLRGMGATLALPLLDAMVPAATAVAKTAAKPVLRLGFIYIPNGANMSKWTPGHGGRRVRAVADLESIGAGGGPPVRPERPDPSDGRGDGEMETGSMREQAPCSSTASIRSGRRGPTSRRARPSIRSRRQRSAKTRRCRRSSCRSRTTTSSGTATTATAASIRTPSRGVHRPRPCRPSTTPGSSSSVSLAKGGRWISGARVWRGSQHSRRRAGRHEAPGADARPGRPQPGQGVSRGRPRDRATDRACRGPGGGIDVAVGFGTSGRDSGGIRRPRPVDVRAAGARLPKRHHPGLHPGDRPRADVAKLPGDWRAGFHTTPCRTIK